MAKKKDRKSEKLMKANLKWIIVLIVFTIVIVSASGNSLLPLKGMMANPTPTVTAMPTIGIPTPSGDFILENYIELSKKDLAAKTGLNTDQIKVMDYGPKEWNDSSLGCPGKGMIYVQMIVSGYIITLQTQNKDFIYHAGLNNVVSCQGG